MSVGSCSKRWRTFSYRVPGNDVQPSSWPSPPRSPRHETTVIKARHIVCAWPPGRPKRQALGPARGPISELARLEHAALVSLRGRSWHHRLIGVDGPLSREASDRYWAKRPLGAGGAAKAKGSLTLFRRCLSVGDLGSGQGRPGRRGPRTHVVEAQTQTRLQTLGGVSAAQAGHEMSWLGCFYFVPEGSWDSVGDCDARSCRLAWHVVGLRLRHRCDALVPAYQAVLEAELESNTGKCLLVSRCICTLDNSLGMSQSTASSECQGSMR